MFGSKKPPAPQPAWTLRVLTTEFFIEGTLAPAEYAFDDNDLFWAALHTSSFSMGVKAFRNRRLTDARVQPTGLLAAPAQTWPQWFLAPSTQIVAIIPSDDASWHAARAAAKDYTHPLPGLVYAGPYRVRGTILSDSATRPALDREWWPVAMQDAEIAHLLPGGQLTNLQAPWALLNSGLIHGVGLD